MIPEPGSELHRKNRKYHLFLDPVAGSGRVTV
jgi:hypothetical protein